MIAPAAMCGLNVVPGRPYCRRHAYMGTYTDTARQLRALATQRDGADLRRDVVTEVRVRFQIGAYRTDEGGQGALDALLDSIS